MFTRHFSDVIRVDGWLIRTGLGPYSQETLEQVPRWVIPCSCPFKRDMGLDFTNFTNFSRFVFSSKQLEYERYGEIDTTSSHAAKNCIGWDGSRSIYFFLRFFWSLFGPLFLIISSYFKPGSLRKSSGDLREHFLKIWLWSGTYSLFIFPKYVIFLGHCWGHFSVIFL